MPLTKRNSMFLNTELLNALLRTERKKEKKRETVSRATKLFGVWIRARVSIYLNLLKRYNVLQSTYKEQRRLKANAADDWFFIKDLDFHN